MERGQPLGPDRADRVRALSAAVFGLGIDAPDEAEEWYEARSTSASVTVRHRILGAVYGQAGYRYRDVDPRCRAWRCGRTRRAPGDEWGHRFPGDLGAGARLAGQHLRAVRRDLRAGHRRVGRGGAGLRSPVRPLCRRRPALRSARAWRARCAGVCRGELRAFRSTRWQCSGAAP